MEITNFIKVEKSADELGELARFTSDETEIVDLIEFEKTLQDNNTRRAFTKKKRIPTLFNNLILNPNLKERDLQKIFDILDNNYDYSCGNHKSHIKSLINILYEDTEQREFFRLLCIISAKHTFIKKN